MALSSIDNSKDSSTANPLSSLDKVDPTQKKIMDAQDELINSISSRGGGTPWFKMAAGFLKPTRSGGFGESLGNVAENISNYQDEQQKQEIPLAQAKIGLLQNKLTAQKEANVRSLLPQLYTTVKDRNGVEQSIFNPEIAQQLGNITGDIKYLSMIPEENRKNQLRVARNNLLTVDGKPGFNANASAQLYSLDPKEALDTFKSIPDLRRAGILPATGAEGTPFDALALSLEGSFKDQAVQLANRYKAGLIKDEDADKMANQLLTASTSHLDRQAAQAQANAIHTLTNILAQSRVQEVKDQNQWRRTDAENKELRDLEIKNKELEAKRSLANDTAQNTLDAVNTIRNHPGRINGMGAYDPRQIIPGTKQHDFVNDMEGLKSSVFSSAIQNMRGMGSLSDAEGKKIMNLYGSLNPSMSKEAFDRTLDTIVKSMNQARDRANKQYSPLQAPKPQNSETNIHSQAIDWAKANPNDPRAKAILDANGVK